MTQIEITVRIENTYENGDEIVTVRTATVPAPPSDEGERDDWAYEHIHALTGTGRIDGDAWYDVEVTASSRPDLLPVGTTFEFGY